jgi:hypothetical protein
MAVEHLSKGNDDGTILGQSATDKVGFYGLATAIVQPIVTAPNTATFTTTMAETHIARLRVALVNLGLVRTT